MCVGLDVWKYILRANIPSCTNPAPRYGIEISDRMFEALAAFLRDEYNTEFAEQFKICDLRRIENEVYAVSFLRADGGAGASIGVWIGVVAWDSDREEWELREVEQTEYGSHA